MSFSNNLVNEAIEKYLITISETHSKQVVNKRRMQLNQFNDVSKSIGVDLLDIDRDQSILLIENMNIIGHNYLFDVDNVLVKFLEWCHNNNYRAAEPIARFNYEEVDLSKAIKKTHFKSPLDFSQFLDEYYLPLNQNSIENSHRVFLWLLFLGVDAKDILTITKDDVVLNKFDHYLIYNNKKIDICPEALRVFEYAVSSSSFVKTFRNGYKVIDYSNPNSLVGYSGSQPFKTIQHSIHIKDLGDNSGKLRFNIVSRSGLYWRIYQSELRENKIDFLEIVKYEYGTEKKYDMRYYRRAEKYLINDYRDWKKAFNY